MNPATPSQAAAPPAHAAEKYEATVMFTIGFAFLPVAVLAPVQIWVLALAGTIAIMGLRLWHRAPVLPLWSPLAILFAVLISWGAVTWFWTIAPERTVYTSLRLVLVAISLVVLIDAASALNQHNRRRFDIWLITGTGVGLLLTAAMMLTNGEFASWIGMHLQRGHELDRLNRTGGVIAILVWPVALVIAHMFGRWVAAAVIALAALAVFALAPSTPILAFISGAAAFSVAWISPVWGKRLLLVAFAVSVVVIPFQDQIVPLARDFLIANIDAPNSEVHRFVIWQFASEQIMNRPLFGWGLDTSRAIPGAEQQLFLFQLGEEKATTGQALPLHPHNALIQIWLELGVIGMLIAGMLFILVVTSIPSVPGNRAGPAILIAAIASAFAIAQLSFGIWQGWWLSTLGLFAVIVVAAAPNDRPARPV